MILIAYVRGEMPRTRSNFHVKVVLEIAMPLCLASIGLASATFGDRASRAFGLGVIVASIPAISLTIVRFAMLISSAVSWLDPEMWGAEAHGYFIGALIWGPLAVLCGAISLLTVLLFFPERQSV